MDREESSRSATSVNTHRRSPLALAGIVCSFVLCVIAHYITPYTHDNHAWHHVHYLMFFVPILLAGITFGLAPGLMVAALASVAYFPLIFLHGGAPSTAMFVENAFELMLYVLVGGGMGWLSDGERRGRARLEIANRELRAQSEQLVQAERRLAQSERLSALGRLAATIAHEVRNPLGSVTGSVEILRDDFPPDHPKRQFLDITLREAERLNATLENFLEFARPPALRLTPVTAAGILDHVATLVDPHCSRHGITLRVDCNGDSATLAADPGQLQQAMLNLVLNSIDAMQHGGELVLRCEELTQDGARCTALTVTDEGTGLSDEAAANVFEPFYSTKPNGTGLGLITVRKIVEAHGGTVALGNRPDGRPGAEARVVLPLSGTTNGSRVQGDKHDVA